MSAALLRGLLPHPGVPSRAPVVVRSPGIDHRATVAPLALNRVLQTLVDRLLALLALLRLLAALGLLRVLGFALTRSPASDRPPRLGANNVVCHEGELGFCAEFGLPPEV